MGKKYVLVEQDEDGHGGIFCMGIYDNVYTAIGYAMTRIWEFGENYKGEGDIFKYSEFEETEGEAGLFSAVEYKKACWTNMAKPCVDYYFILEYEFPEEGD